MSFNYKTMIRVHSAATLGVDCIPIEVEVDVAPSWPGFQIVGLTDTAIQESKERIRTAWKNTGLEFPTNSRIVINLSPADIRKEGASFDVPMAIGMYIAAENIEDRFGESLIVGELALDGSLPAIRGILSLAIHAKARGLKEIFVPTANVREACMVDGINVYPVNSLLELINHLRGIKPISRAENIKISDFLSESTFVECDFDMAHIRGQEFAKRALEIAASGGHNILLSGPPGSGKTLLAKTLPSILPTPTFSEALEITKIHSVAGTLSTNEPIIKIRPFRTPHHTSSDVALVGGGKIPRPGEISLAHRGVLFLDEFPEFPRMVLESLRQPLEDGVVSISRAQGTITFPARFMLVASQNPCPCGFASDVERSCTCSPGQITRYQKKISGPLLDRIDLHAEVPRVKFEKLSSEETAESSKNIRERVMLARDIQTRRFANTKFSTNSEMGALEIKNFCSLDFQSSALIGEAVSRLHLSARSYHRILKLSRTIADLAASPNIKLEHVAEALQYRPKVDL